MRPAFSVFHRHSPRSEWCVIFSNFLFFSFHFNFETFPKIKLTRVWLARPAENKIDVNLNCNCFLRQFVRRWAHTCYFCCDREEESSARTYNALNAGKASLDADRESLCTLWVSLMFSIWLHAIMLNSRADSQRTIVQLKWTAEAASEGNTRERGGGLALLSGVWYWNCNLLCHRILLDPILFLCPWFWTHRRTHTHTHTHVTHAVVRGAPDAVASVSPISSTFPFAHWVGANADLTIVSVGCRFLYLNKWTHALCSHSLVRRAHFFNFHVVHYVFIIFFLLFMLWYYNEE